MSGTIVAESLARAVAAHRARTLPAPMRETAERLLIDIAGLCVAARGEDYVRARMPDRGGLAVRLPAVERGAHVILAARGDT